jgi:hypothetical protein
MKTWHETLAAQFGLRIGGLAVLALAWVTGAALYAQVHAHPPAPAHLHELGLCAVLVLLLIVGGCLAVVGPGLWRRVEIPRRWTLAPI